MEGDSVSIVQETITRVKHGYLEKLIEQLYGKKFDFIEDQQCLRGSSHFVEIRKKEFDEHDHHLIESFIFTGVVGFIFHMLVADLCNRGRIDEGNYLVDVRE